VNRAGARQSRGRDGDESAHRGRRQRDSGRSACHRKQHALGQDEPHEPDAARADRGAQRELAAPPRATRQQEARHVHAGDHEHQQDGTGHHEEHRLHAAHERRLQRLDRDPRGGVIGPGPAFGEHRASRRVRLARRAVERHARRDPRDGHQVMAPLAAVHRQRLVVLQRRPDLGAGRGHVLEARRHHADDGVGRVVEADLASDHRGIRAEPAAPEAVADDHQPRAAQAIVVPSEAAAEHGRDAEHVEVSRRDPLAFETLGRIPAQHDRLPAPGDGDRLERPRANVERAIHRERADIRDTVLQHRADTGRVGIRQAGEEDRVDCAEDCRACTDAERQRRDGNQREGRRAAQAPGGLLHVRRRRGDDVLPAGAADLFAHSHRMSPGRACGARRLCGGSAARLEISGRLGKEKADLLVYVGVGGARIQQRAGPARDRPPQAQKHRHVPSFALRATERKPPSALRVQQARDRRGAARPVRRLDLELPAALARQLVVPRAPRVLRLTPLGVEPAGALEPLQRREERPRVHLEHPARHLLDPPRDAEAVHRLEADRLEDEHVERALDDAVVRHAATIRLLILIVKMWRSR
jgi:hypothetical protein